MIKVHCFVSCVCEIIKRTPGVDHRPFYFGVWDADFSLSERYRISYHSEHTGHEFFKTWYELLYGIRIHEWYDRAASKAENLEHLITLVETRAEHRHIMVMLDLYHLPERENKFNQNPFPHYVMLQATEDPEEWLMLDPDFRWEGRLPKDQILNAVAQPTVAGGFYFDGIDITHSSADTIRAYFAQCMKREANPLTDAVRQMIRAHIAGENDLTLSDLNLAMRELPVLSIRKYAYEHAFAWFYEALSLPWDEFEDWCDVIELLVKTYRLIQYRSMKMVMTGDVSQAAELYQLLDQQDNTEFRIKNGLQSLFEDWSRRSLQLSAHPTVTERTETCR
ncbi:DUF6005 family protein [Allohahella marinimesophila]|uniref:Petrobactin biosynthesis protein AsbE n=1 Tax=Allohahella marinimesophila TaxID=1054972 RepID=A0ABP7NWY1_9GAMM